MILGELCVLSLIYCFVVVCGLCAVRCLIIVCVSLLFSNYRTYVFLTFLLYMFFVLYFCSLFHVFCGPGSSVGIATGYGLDGPGSNPGGDEIFRPFRPALGSTQSPVKWVPGLYRG